MISSSRGIVLNFISYRETSIIVRIYTENHGLQSFIVNNVRSARSKQSLANYQPLSLLEIVAYQNPQKEIQRLSEAKIIYAPRSFHTVKKSTVLLFLAEMMSKVLIHEHEENEELFQFLWNSIVTYDSLDEKYENFHIRFLLRLTKLLGFDLNSNEELEKIGQGDPHIFDFLKHQSQSDYFSWYPLSSELRLQVLTNIIRTYQMHVEHLSEIRSLKVLKTVFHH